MEDAKQENCPQSPKLATADVTGVGPTEAAAAGSTGADQNQNPNNRATTIIERTPFTNLSQVDADLALARALQEQERAYLMLRRNGVGEFDSTDDEEYEEEDDEDVGGEHQEQGEGELEGGVEGERGEDELNLEDFEDDEAYVRAVQLQEAAGGRNIVERLMRLAGLNGWAVEHEDDDSGGDDQDGWRDVDPDELSYEELIALGEVVGVESRGLSADTMASLPSINYKAVGTEDGNTDQCVICRLDYEDGETLVVLSCKHLYHPDCINKWLEINKVCPLCNTEVSTSDNTRDQADL